MNTNAHNTSRNSSIDTSRVILYTADIVAQYGIAAGTLRWWRHCGVGPASFKVGRRTAYRRGSVEEWIAASEAATRRGGLG